MTGRRWRFMVVVLCGLVWLAAAYLLITTNSTCRDASGRSLGFMDCGGSGVSSTADGLGGRIGIDTLDVVALVAFLGMAGGLAAEVWVRHRTTRRRRRGEPWWTRP